MPAPIGGVIGSARNQHPAIVQKRGSVELARESRRARSRSMTSVLGSYSSAVLVTWWSPLPFDAARHQHPAIGQQRGRVEAAAFGHRWPVAVQDPVPGSYTSARSVTRGASRPSPGRGHRVAAWPLAAGRRSCSRRQSIARSGDHTVPRWPERDPMAVSPPGHEHRAIAEEGGRGAARGLRNHGHGRRPGAGAGLVQLGDRPRRPSPRRRPPPARCHWAAAWPCDRRGVLVMIPVGVHDSVRGSYSSAEASSGVPPYFVNPLQLCPPATSTLPSGRSVAVCPPRASIMVPVAVHDSVRGSYSSAVDSPIPISSDPPTTRTRPSASRTREAHREGCSCSQWRSTPTPRSPLSGSLSHRAGRAAPGGSIAPDPTRAPPPNATTSSTAMTTRASRREARGSVPEPSNTGCLNKAGAEWRALAQGVLDAGLVHHEITSWVRFGPERGHAATGRGCARRWARCRGCPAISSNGRSAA